MCSDLKALWKTLDLRNFKNALSDWEITGELKKQFEKTNQYVLDKLKA